MAVEKLTSSTAATVQVYAAFFEITLAEHDRFLQSLRSLTEAGFDLPSLRRIMMTEIQMHPELMDLLLLDAQGRVVLWTQDGPAPDVSGRLYYQAHLTDGSDRLHISPPLASMVHADEYFFSLSRPILDREGNFDGVVVSILSVDRLAALSETIDLAPGTSLSVSTAEGEILFRLPRVAGDTGMRRAEMERVGRQEEHLATQKLICPFDDCERMVSFFRLGDYPIVIAASEGTELAMAAVSARARMALGAFVAVAFALAAVTLLLCRQLHRHDAIRQAMRAEIDERLKAEAALKEREEVFAAIVESSVDLIFQIRPDGFMSYCSPAAREIMGAAPEEMVGTHFKCYVHPDDHPRAVEAFQTVLGGGTVRSLELKLLRGAANSFHSEVNVTPVHSERGVVGVQGIVRDVSERQRAAEALRLTSDELARSNADLEQFAYAVSHDMRQPLRMVTSYLQLIERELEGKLDAETREFMRFATDGARRMDAMIRGLLEYSRVGRRYEPKKPLDSREALDEALSFLAPAIQDSAAQLVIEGEWPTIFASRDEMVRLFQNLIANALTYRSQEANPRLEVRAARAEGEYLFTVRDNGIGIAPKNICRLFTVFTRLQSRAHYDGNGLGLALCRKIVEHHGGRIWAESAGEGKGSLFGVALPVTDIAAAPPPQSAAEAS